jgi:hypothetical protein
MLRPCPCGAKVIAPIIDCRTGARFCHHCAPCETDYVKFARKLQECFDQGLDLDVAYPISERDRNLHGDWTPIQ